MINLENKVWAVYRKDDNGNMFLVKPNLTKSEAESVLEKYERKGHKQVYWIEENKK